MQWILTYLRYAKLRLTVTDALRKELTSKITPAQSINDGIYIIMTDTLAF